MTRHASPGWIGTGLTVHARATTCHLHALLRPTAHHACLAGGIARIAGSWAAHHSLSTGTAAAGGIAAAWPSTRVRGIPRGTAAAARRTVTIAAVLGSGWQAWPVGTIVPVAGHFLLLLGVVLLLLLSVLTGRLCSGHHAGGVMVQRIARWTTGGHVGGTQAA